MNKLQLQMRDQAQQSLQLNGLFSHPHALCVCDSPKLYELNTFIQHHPVSTMISASQHSSKQRIQVLKDKDLDTISRNNFFEIFFHNHTSHCQIGLLNNYEIGIVFIMVKKHLSIQHNDISWGIFFLFSRMFLGLYHYHTK